MTIIDRTDTVLRKKLFMNIALVIFLVIMGIFLGFFLRNRQLINEMLLVRARTNFYTIVITRKWNAGYGGVYVEKKKGVESNTYLKNPDIRSVDGKTFTMKNPALMTREISEIGRDEGLFTYHITSLNPLNPDNKPDSFEKGALKKFEKGEREISGIIKAGDKHYLRYMGPLYVEKSCLNCHAVQGYKTGDIRGGISVRFEITELIEILEREKISIIILSVISVMILFGFIYWFAVRVLDRLRRAYQKIEYLAITDDLTGLFNRRYFFMRLDQEIDRSKRYKEDLACIMIDLDHFKNINDTYGHQAGDLVLKTVSNIIKHFSRNSDIVARYGGEEIIVLLPETDSESAVVFAEKIREAVEECSVPVQKFNVSVTASFGVSSLNLTDEDEDAKKELIVKADRALYIAKKNGRNRVEYYD